MMPGISEEDRRFWLVCLAAGLVILAGCLLPTIEVGQEAFIGAGETQRGFDYDRTVRFATYFEPGSMLFVLGGIGLVGLAVVALVRGSRAIFVLAAALVSLAFVVEAVRIGDELRWEERGVYACQTELEDCVPFIAPAVRDLQAEILRRPEAHDREFELLDRNGYRSRGKGGWWVIVWTTVVIAGVTAFRAFNLVLRPLWAGVAVAACALVGLVILVLKSLEGLE
jgi:hypothetical protein